MREAILKELVEAVKRIAGNKYSVTTQETTKNNNVKRLVIEIGKRGETVIPRVYVDDIVYGVEVGFMTVEEAAKKVFEMYQNSEGLTIEMDVEKWIDRRFILDHVEYQLVNAERNARNLKDIPGKKIADLVAIYRLVISLDEDGMKSYVLTNANMASLGISIKELDEAAKQNTEKSGFFMKTMNEVMYELIGVSVKPEIDLPSSIHELLAIPVSNTELEELREMVKEVNDNIVEPKEILGYGVYRYNRETGEIEAAM